MQKIIPVVGTRPEAIKLAPVIKELERHPEKFETPVTASGYVGLLLVQNYGPQSKRV